MNAKEARELSHDRLNGITTSVLEDVHKSINSAIKKGEFECYYYKALTKSAKQDLENDGYKIEGSYNQMDGHTYLIKW